MLSYNDRLNAATGGAASLCLGIDPSAEQLGLWGLPDTAAAAENFALTCIEAASEQISIVKFQVGFFERFGSTGLKALENANLAARAAGLFVIADAKRGDIGSTMLGYCQAWLDDESPLAGDALTVSPYLGLGALDETADFAQSRNRGLFVLAATSNVEGSQLQLARLGNTTVANSIVSEVSGKPNANVGLVIGATLDLAAYELDWITETDCNVPLLVPGYGAQGASLVDVKRFGASAHRVIANVSRAVTAAGPQGVDAQLESARALL